MGTEQWHAVIYFRDGRKVECAYSNDERMTAFSAQQLYDQYMRTAIDKVFEPTSMRIVQDK